MRADGAKGHLDLLLLAVLSGGPGHGYAVIAGLRERTSGALELAEGAVYPALHRLEDAGLLASQWQPVAGRRRRVYSVTATGMDALAQERRSWAGLVASVEAVLRPLPSAAEALS
jgi:PadR family transcriptional regulator, regulatory protein PadR